MYINIYIYIYMHIYIYPSIYLLSRQVSAPGPVVGLVGPRGCIDQWVAAFFWLQAFLRSSLHG